MRTQTFINHFQPITDNNDKIAKRVYRLLLDKCMQFLQCLKYIGWYMNKVIFITKHEFILHVNSPQKFSENPSMDN